MTDPILPDVDDPEAAPFWRGAAEGKLLFQRCGRCGHGRFRPQPFCPQCASAVVSWVEASGRGAVWSYVVSYPPTAPAFAPFAPYPVLLVALDDDPRLRMVGNLVAYGGAPINSVPLKLVRIGLPVAVVFHRLEDQVYLPQWTPLA